MKYVLKRKGITVYMCHGGCGKPLGARELSRNDTSHDACRNEAIRRLEVAQARRDGISVREWRLRRVQQGLPPTGREALSTQKTG